GHDRAEGAPEQRGHDRHRPVTPGAQGPQGPAHRHDRPGRGRRRARHRAPRGRPTRKEPTVSVNVWIVVGDQPAIGNLITVARSLGGPVGAVVAGPRSVGKTVAASGVDKEVWGVGPDDGPARASAPAVAEPVPADPPRVLLAGRNPGDRVLLGAAAAALKAAVLTGARSVSADGDGVIVVNAV